MENVELEKLFLVYRKIFPKSWPYRMQYFPQENRIYWQFGITFLTIWLMNCPQMSLESFPWLMFWIAGVAWRNPLAKWVCFAPCLSNHWLFLTTISVQSLESSLESLHSHHIKIETSSVFPFPTVDMFRQLSHLLDWINSMIAVAFE